MAGLKFSDANDSLRLVVDNGVSRNDPRVMRRTNEATQEILAEIIPVNGMLTVDVTLVHPGVDDIIILPKEMKSVIAASVQSSDLVNAQSDVKQSFYNIVNPFTYIDPSMAHDNPLVDRGLIAGENDTLVRSYAYPGLGSTSGTVIRVTGPKAYLPITTDNDYLIVQNVPALKLMIQAIERRENLDIDNAAKYKAECLNLLQAEVKLFMMDPMGVMSRKANWEADLRTFKLNTMGWFRARLALEVPGAQNMGKEEITRLIERSEMRCMELGIMKGCIEEFTAPVVCGHVVMPQRVESILAADLCGNPMPVRSIFYKYMENGPGDWCRCDNILEDEGEILMNDGQWRRKYRLNTGGVDMSTTTTTTDSTGGTSGDVITAGSYLYIGDHARLVAMVNGMRLEVLDDGTGTWIDQGEWIE